MKVSTSILSIKENLQENIQKLEQSTTDYIHLDIMDSIFVSNKTWNVEESKMLVKEMTKPLDIHLMVSDLDKYIEDFSLLNPVFITFHYEATLNIAKYISLLKEKGIKVGISIKPDTGVDVLKPFLKDIDLVLVMSVEPGLGGQKFLDSSLTKIKWLTEQRQNNGYNYLIEVDGGINEQTVELISEAGADIAVSGSFITNSLDYQKQIDTLKNNKKDLHN